MTTRLTATLVICWVGILACFAAAPARSESEFPAICEDIAHEINNAYIEGLISEEEARGVIDRCLERFS